MILHSTDSSWFECNEQIVEIIVLCTYLYYFFLPNINANKILRFHALFRQLYNNYNALLKCVGSH